MLEAAIKTVLGIAMISLATGFAVFRMESQQSRTRFGMLFDTQMQRTYSALTESGR